MSEPMPLPLDDAELGMLLGRHSSPPLRAGFADRVLAEAQRPDRPRVLPVAPPPRRSARRWTRRGIWSGVIAVNLIVASAIAAAVGGGAIHLSHVVDVVAQALHVRHHAAAPHPVAVVHHAPVAHPVAAMPAILPATTPAAPPAAVMAAPVAMQARAPIEHSRAVPTEARPLHPLPIRAAPIRHEEHGFAKPRRELALRHPERSERPERAARAAEPDRPRPTVARDHPVRDEGTARANLAAREAMAAPIAQPGATADRGLAAGSRTEQQSGQTPRADGTRAQGWRQQPWRQRQQAWQQRYQAWQQRQQGPQPGQQAPGGQATAPGDNRVGNPNPSNPHPGLKKNKPAGGKGLRRGLGRRRL